MKKISFKWIFNFSVLAISLGILCYFAFTENGVLDLVHNVKGINYLWLLAALFCVITEKFLDCQILYIFTKNLHPEYRYLDCFRSAMTGQFFSAVTPFASGGQPMQIYIMSRQGVSTSKSLSALIQKFIVFQATMTGYALLLMVLSWGFFKEKLSAYLYMAIVAFLINLGIILVLTLFSRNRWLTRTVFRGIYSFLAKLRLIKNPEERLASLQEQLDLFHDNNLQLKRNVKLVFQSVLFTFLQMTAIFLVPFCVYKAFLYPGYPIVEMLTAISVVNMITAFIPLPGGSGAAEGSFLIFFGIFFLLPGTLTPAVFIWRFLTYYLTIAAGAPFALAGKKKRADQPTIAA